MQPWKTLERVATPEGSLELRQRGARSFLITIAGRVLMTSDAHRSETELAQAACAALAGRPRPRVLIGGLGMGFTLRAVLDELPAAASVTVVELNAAVVGWCKGPLASLTKDATSDGRVKIVVGDVARVIADARAGSYDAIILDLYEGPHQANNRASDPLYGPAALRRMADALALDGVLAVWSEEPDKSFELRLGVHLTVERRRGAGGGRTHVIYLGTRDDRPRFSAARPAGPTPAAGAGGKRQRRRA
jgi:spermidine synthase